jgi:hypothetical protein
VLSLVPAGSMDENRTHIGRYRSVAHLLHLRVPEATVLIGGSLSASYGLESCVCRRPSTTS